MQNRIRSIFLITLLALAALSAKSQRLVQTLNSAWTFESDQHPGVTHIVNLPHTWNNKDAFQDDGKYYRGIGTYTKKMFVPKALAGQRVFLKFEGANSITKLWVNDQLVGEHRGGYTSFVFEVTDQLNFGQENQFKITCDNRYNPDVPPLEADFNFYGGIYRDVYLVVSNPVHFELANDATGNLMVRTPKVTEQEAMVSVEGKLVNQLQLKQNCVLQIQLFQPDGTAVKTSEQKLTVNGDQHLPFSLDFQLKSPELWSPEHPNLYRVIATLSDKKSGELLDQCSTSFGCRWFHFDPEDGFFLNGKHVKLVGVNRHQDFQGLGDALPNALHDRDFRMIKAMGANFVRLAHYPQDPEVYHMCDELGLLVWSEIPVINDVTDSKAYFDNCLQMQREQVSQLFNHPSIILWGTMNEIFIRTVFNRQITDQKKQQKIKVTVDLARQINAETKKLDSSRNTVMALHQNEIYNTSGIADITDVIGWNLYFGWYSPGLENLGKFLDDQHKRYPNRPLIISEYGPGSDDRIQTDDPKPWDYSEAYQLKSHESYYRQLMARTYISGMTAWNFVDFGSSGRQDTRPFINQKGLLNYDRTPKDIYHYYQALLLKSPYVFIAGTYRPEIVAEDVGSGKGKLPVTVFSNQESVELTINDSLSLQAPVNEGIARFGPELPEGKYHLQAKSGEATCCAEKELRLHSKLISEIDQSPIAINVGTHCDYTDPVTKEVWISDEEYGNDGFGYEGGQVYQQSKNKFEGTPINILGTDNDPLFQTMREGINRYRFDVGKGQYRVTLLFAEYNREASDQPIYNLTTEKTQEVEGQRDFSVKINGQTRIADLNLARDYDAGRAVTISFDVSTEKGIHVEFGKIAGEPVLSGIKLEKQ